MFANSEDDLQQIAADTLKYAKTMGADEVALSCKEGFALDVNVRAGKTEAINFTQTIACDIEVYCGQRKSMASCNSFRKDDLTLALERSIAIARQMNEDDCEGLPDANELATSADLAVDLDSYHPWRPSVEAMVKQAIEMEEASWVVDPRISRTKSEGGSVTTVEGRSVLANSSGFMAATTQSRHSLGCGVIADLDGSMESAGWMDAKVAAADLEGHLDIARKAAERAIARAGIRPITNTKVPVLFEAGVAKSLLGSFLQTLAGSRVYRKLTCFGDHLGQELWAQHVNLYERPFLPRGMNSDHYDGEGVRTSAKNIVTDGVLQTYLLDSYSARKINSRTTGNCGGVHNLRVDYRTLSLEDLLQEMGTGLFVTGIMGGGANTVTGDYSAGAYGFWVVDGTIVHPVKDATIAGSLPAMMRGLVAGGDDWLERGNYKCGSLLVDSMTVAGAGTTS